MRGKGAQTWATMERDWGDLCEAWNRRPVPPAWRALLPEHARPIGVLAPTMLADLFEWVTHGDDAVTRALLRLAQAGHTAAGRVVVQAMLLRLWFIARRDPHNSFDDYISAAWIRLMTFPALKRRQAVLTNLTLDCLKLVSRHASKSKREVAVDAKDMSEIFDMPPWRILESPEETRAYVKSLLDLAMQQGALSEMCFQVAESVYCHGLPRREVAARHGISYDMVRYYCCTSVKTLRRMSRELIEDLGPPQ